MNSGQRIRILNALMKIEIDKISKYSTSVSCSEAKKGCEAQYNRHKEKIRAIQMIRDKWLFSEANLTFYLSHFIENGRLRNNRVKNTEISAEERKYRTATD